MSTCTRATGLAPPRGGAGRGAESWTYIYVVFAVTLAIEGAAFETIPIPFPYDLVALFIVVLGTATCSWPAAGFKASY